MAWPEMPSESAAFKNAAISSIISQLFSSSSVNQKGKNPIHNLATNKTKQKLVPIHIEQLMQLNAGAKKSSNSKFPLNVPYRV